MLAQVGPPNARNDQLPRRPVVDGLIRNLALKKQSIDCSAGEHSQHEVAGVFTEMQYPWLAVLGCRQQDFHSLQVHIAPATLVQLTLACASIEQQVHKDAKSPVFVG